MLGELENYHLKFSQHRNAFISERLRKTVMHIQMFKFPSHCHHQLKEQGIMYFEQGN